MHKTGMYLRSIKYIRIATLAITAFLLWSCVQEDLIIDDNLSDNDVIKVKASISATDNMTRAYYGSDEVETLSDGVFYMTYPRNANGLSYSYAQYDLATVTFGHPEDPTTGYVSYEKDGKTRDLKWLSVAGEGRSSVYLFMHNINPDWFSYTNSSNTYSNQKYTFNSQSPYFASPLDTINGTNDLLSSGYSSLTSTGYVSGSASTNIVFPLFHRMALLKVNVEVYDAGDGNIVDLSNAEVTLTNLYTKLVSFHVYYPYSFTTSNSSSYGQYSTRANITLVGDKDSDTHYGWKSVTVNPDFVDSQGEKSRQDTYSVQDFVIPPQTLESGYQPQLIVRVPKEDVTGAESDKGLYMEYKGYLPNVMYAADENGNATSQTPIATSFTSGYELHVTATINSPETEITFAPVKVEQWVSKSNFYITTHQAGIYSKSDFMDLINAYNEGDTQQLMHYGYKSGDLFIFQFWSTLTFDLDEIQNQMPVNPSMPYTFLLNDYTVTVEGDDTKEELSGTTGQDRLYNIVSGGVTTTFTGIRTREDFEKVVELCNPTDTYTSPDVLALMQYGNLNNYDNIWTFDLQTSLEFEIDEIFKSIDGEFLGNTVRFNYNDNSVTINMPDNEKIICNSETSENFDKFGRLLVADNPGIYSADDFYFLTECYNNYYSIYPDILTLYGTVSGSSWAFLFRNMMNLEGDKTFMSMIPNTSEGRPNYTITYNSSFSYTITIEDQYTPLSVTTSSSSYTGYLQNMFSGSGKATSTTTFSSVVTYYNNKNYMYLWSYGYFDRNTLTWTFPLAYSNSQYIAYSSLFGKMIPSEDEGKYDYNFYLGSYYYQVRTMPVSEGSSSTQTYYFYQNGNDTYSYPNTAADLKKVALGTYWEDYNP